VRLLAASLAIFVWLGAVTARPAAMDFHPLTEISDGPMETRAARDAQALTEMFGSSQMPQRWRQAPALTVLASVMEYQPGGDVDYVATRERLSDADVAELVRDLTGGLTVLTANTFEEFSSVGFEVVPAGDTARVSRPNQIVVGRFSGLRRSVKTLGYGGRQARKDGTITAGAVLLDSEFDATSARRRLLRTHELGHALGYNHVHSRTSVMNPNIGTEPNDFDREAAFIAFRAPPAIVASR
jgi:Matrixin